MFKVSKALNLWWIKQNQELCSLSFLNYVDICGNSNTPLADLYINPLVPSVYKSARIAKISNLKLEGITKKISYECCDYEPVDEKSIFIVYAPPPQKKNKKKKNSGIKGLIQYIH